MKRLAKAVADAMGADFDEDSFTKELAINLDPEFEYAVVKARVATAAEARRLWERLEVHYTPKHGSWLNMAETELSVLSGQCLDRRIDEVTFLRSEVGSWEEHRNRTEAKVRWRFTTEDARIKLEKLYPVFEYPDPH